MIKKKNREYFVNYLHIILPDPNKGFHSTANKDSNIFGIWHHSYHPSNKQAQVHKTSFLTS